MLSVNQDFEKLLTELKEKGVSGAMVAGVADVTPSAISDVANGKTTNPRWETGATIVRMHQRYVQGEK